MDYVYDSQGNVSGRRYRESPNRLRYVFQYGTADEVGTRPLTYGQIDSSEADNVDIGMCLFEESGDLKGSYTLHDGAGPILVGLT